MFDVSSEQLEKRIADFIAHRSQSQLSPEPVSLAFKKSQKRPSPRKLQKTKAMHWIAKYKSRNGRWPKGLEVIKYLGLPRSTAYRYLKQAKLLIRQCPGHPAA